MKTNVSTNDIQEAMARVEKAKANRSNAARRLSRSQAAVEVATKDVSEAEDELKAASANLDQAVRKGLSLAMKKGGTEISIAMAEIIARSLGGASSEEDDGQGDAKGTEPQSPTPPIQIQPAGAPDAGIAKGDAQPDLLGAAE